MRQSSCKVRNNLVGSSIINFKKRIFGKRIHSCRIFMVQFFILLIIPNKVTRRHNSYSPLTTDHYVFAMTYCKVDGSVEQPSVGRWLVVGELVEDLPVDRLSIVGVRWFVDGPWFCNRPFGYHFLKPLLNSSRTFNSPTFIYWF